MLLRKLGDLLIQILILRFDVTHEDGKHIGGFVRWLLCQESFGFIELVFVVDSDRADGQRVLILAELLAHELPGAFTSQTDVVVQAMLSPVVDRRDLCNVKNVVFAPRALEVIPLRHGFNYVVDRVRVCFFAHDADFYPLRLRLQGLLLLVRGPLQVRVAQFDSHLDSTPFSACYPVTYETIVSLANKKSITDRSI